MLWVFTTAEIPLQDVQCPTAQHSSASDITRKRSSHVTTHHRPWHPRVAATQLVSSSHLASQPSPIRASTLPPNPLQASRCVKLTIVLSNRIISLYIIHIHTGPYPPPTSRLYHIPCLLLRSHCLLHALVGIAHCIPCLLQQTACAILRLRRFVGCRLCGFR